MHYLWALLDHLLLIDTDFSRLKVDIGGYFKTLFPNNAKVPFKIMNKLEIQKTKLLIFNSCDEI